MAKYAVFKANVEIIEAHNKLYEAGEETYHLAVNAFADMTNAEYKKMLGYREDLRKMQGAPTPGGHGKACKHRSNTNKTKHIDWRTEGAVTPVKNQGQCGSCWSFSTTGAVEGAWVVAGHELISLSEEELVQCDTRSDEGCNGGLMDNAYEFIINNGGIASEQVYPYISGNGTRGMCNQVTLRTKMASIEDWCDLNVGDEKDLELALMQQVFLPMLLPFFLALVLLPPLQFHSMLCSTAIHPHWLSCSCHVRSAQRPVLTLKPLCTASLWPLRSRPTRPPSSSTAAACSRQRSAAPSSTTVSSRSVVLLPCSLGCVLVSWCVGLWLPRMGQRGGAQRAER